MRDDCHETERCTDRRVETGNVNVDVARDTSSVCDYNKLPIKTRDRQSMIFRAVQPHEKEQEGVFSLGRHAYESRRGETYSARGYRILFRFNFSYKNR